MSSITFGPYIFPMNPTSYRVPPVKKTEVGYSLDGTMVLNTGLYNQNEFTLSWEGVINDINGIVSYLKSFIRNETRRNDKDKGPRMFNDHMGLYHGYATLVGADMNMVKKGGVIAYTFNLTFRLG